VWNRRDLNCVQFRALRQQARLNPEQLVDALVSLAQAGAAAEYRLVECTLVSLWEGRVCIKGTNRPRAYMLYLIRVFGDQLDLESARTWAAQAVIR
jgi:hypothetical protein